MASIVNRWRRDRWQRRIDSGSYPIVSSLKLSKARRGEGPLIVSAWGFQPMVGERGLWCQPWGQLVVEESRWKRGVKRIVESLLEVRSEEDLLNVDGGRFMITKEVSGRGFYDRNMVVSVNWMEPDLLEIQPLKGADRSAVGVWELGRSVAVEVRKGQVYIKISEADFADQIDALLRYSEIVSTRKLRQALALLAKQGVILRESK